MSNWNNNQNIFHYLSAVIDHFLRVNEKLPFTEHLYQSIIVHMSALFWWNTTWYALYKWYCDLNTCGQAGWAAGTGAAPVLALPTCKPAAAARNTATTLATISVLYSAQAAPRPPQTGPPLSRGANESAHIWWDTENFWTLWANLWTDQYQ